MKPKTRQTIGNILFALAALIILALVTHCRPAHAADAVPPAAKQHRALLTRTANAYWGFDAPVATFAAQIHQESLWRTDARSPVGAQGIAQFMPATSAWFATVHPQSLGTPQPFNVGWSLRAMVLYDASLYKQNQASNICDRWAMTLSAYNGGQGWVNRDRRMALAASQNPLLWFNSIEKFNAGRSAANFKENRDYPRKILFRWEPIYEQAGWGSGTCEGYSF